jgi:hypothetical protein
MTDWAPSCEICDREIATVLMAYPDTGELAHVGPTCRRQLEHLARLLGVKIPRPALRLVKR